MLAREELSSDPIEILFRELRSESTARADVHVWRIHLRADQTGESTAVMERLLSAPERLRADSFRSREQRSNYIETRSALHCLLGRYLQQDPAEVQIETGAFGKPFLASPDQAWLCFNLAHSGAQALVALGRERLIGVDIEKVHANIDHPAIAENFFAPEERAELARLPYPERLQAFFNFWTRKEAYLKATGRGLLTALDSFVVSAKPRLPSALLKLEGDATRASGWTLRDIPVAPGYVGAVAAEGQISALRCLDYNAAFQRASTPDE